MSQATGSISQGTIQEQTKTLQGLRPVALTATVNGIVLDRSTFQALLLVLSVGAISGTPTLDVKVQHGTESDGSDMVDAVAGPLPGSGVTFAQITTANQDAIELLVDVRKLNQFVRPVFTVGGGSPNLVTSLIAVLSGADNYPA
ncbi:hypothetical protein LCGC14_0441240 [marine sediment metagenome]|uniref:Uncharacterized protein n=1 Tax=marine sediment metagenome TaxID=412755 RepID=A0A0F9T3I3_9ZZZZ